MIILVNPPVMKASEPPLGIARLAGALEAEHIPHTIVDANLEGLLYFLSSRVNCKDTWTKRAHKNVQRDLSAIRSWVTYRNIDKYKTSIYNLNRILFSVAKEKNQYVSLTDYAHKTLSPVRSADLLVSFQIPEDNLFFPYFSERFEALIAESRPKIVGFSLSFLQQAFCTFSMAGFIKRKFPDVRLVLGGSLVGSWSESVPFLEICREVFDHVIAGPGESKIVALYRKNEPIPKHYPPAYAGFCFADYLAPAPILPYNTSTGCYWNKCTFCPENAEENAYLPNSAINVFDEIEALSNEISPGIIHFTDSALSPAFLSRYQTKNLNTPWYGFMRVERDLCDPDFARALKNSGCIMIELGIESGNDRVLEAINKGTTVNLASSALHNLKQAGIATYVYLLFGTPEEDSNSALDTLSFVASHYECIDFLNISLFNMPVKSDSVDHHVTSDFYVGDLSLYTDFVHPKGWQRAKVRKFLDTEFKTHRAIAPILQRKPTSFTSNHAPLFVLA
jgi:hypothetical protein